MKPLYRAIFETVGFPLRSCAMERTSFLLPRNIRSLLILMIFDSLLVINVVDDLTSLL